MAAKKKSPASDGAGRKARRRDARIGFEALSIEGGLLSPDWLARIAQLGAQGQSEADYRVPRGLALRDEIGRYWRIAQAHWTDFTSGRKSGADAGLLAERFVVALVRQCFGFESLVVVAPIVIADRTYPIGHAALGGRAPLVVAAPKPDEEASARSALDEPRSAHGDGTRKRSPFGLVQEYLNAQESALWGLVSDGLTLRIVRDNASLTRPVWIEADLARIFAEERYADFAALWLLVHESRFGGVDQPVSACVLEAWRAEGREEGTRAREDLRLGVKEALLALGQGFVSHPANQALRATLEAGDGAKKDFFNQLLRLVYRVIFLLTVEERGVLHAEGANEQAKRLYADGYSLRKLRERAVRRSAHDRHSDAWEGVKIVFRGVERGEPRLGLPALSGIFAASQCPTLDGAKLENRALMTAVFKLSWLKGESGLARVNWRDMGPEELGSVYESLLELVPQLRDGGRTFDFATGDETKGNARKTTGSYYTPDSLVQVLLDSALEPVVRETIAANPANPVDALLGLSIVDPACGSGHFLLAAARRLAAHVARLSTSGTPSAAEYRHALRLVVGRCIYGVDLNPMAVELCKVSLWMEAVEPGLPLTFLNSHIQHGNALLGTTPELMSGGVPDAAWEAIEGDDKKVAGALKKRNKAAAGGQRGLDLFGGAGQEDPLELARRVGVVEASPDGDLEGLIAKEAKWGGFLDSAAYRRQKLTADAWCAAFVWPKMLGEVGEAAPTNEVWRQIRDGRGGVPALTVKTVEELAERYRFLHWGLAFPQVFARGGFDVVLGNPPWERVKLQEQEFFASKSAEIAGAVNAAARKKLIARLPVVDPRLWEEWCGASREAEGQSQLIRGSDRYPLCGKGDINTYALFAEHNRAVLGPRGRAGFIVPTGVATDDTTKSFFADLMSGRTLASFVGFENEGKLFREIDHRVNFCLLTISAKPVDTPTFAAFLREPAAMHDPGRTYRLSGADIRLLNPNTLTCPVFRHERDARICIGVWTRLGVLWDETSPVGNRWQLRFMAMFHMANDSSMFRTTEQLSSSGYRREENRFLGRDAGDTFVPLLEAKMLHHFNHRFGDFALLAPGEREHILPQLSDGTLAAADYFATPRYWIPATDVRARLGGAWDHAWMIGWRDVTDARSSVRTAVFAILPATGAGHTVSLLFAGVESALAASLYATTCSFAFDYCARQKIGGVHLTQSYLKQLPAPSPQDFLRPAPWDRAQRLVEWVLPRVLELTYTAWDLAAFGCDVGYEGPPFRWEPTRRFHLRCELDAAFFVLYGLTRDDVGYVMDTFPIVRRSDEQHHGSYRTSDTILEMFDAMSAAIRSGVPYQTRLNPPPADPECAHQPRAALSALTAPPRPVNVPASAPLAVPAAPPVAVPLRPAALSSLPANAWVRPAAPAVQLVEDVLVAVLRRLSTPAPGGRFRLAAALCLEPHFLAPMLSTAEQRELSRLVGPDAEHAANRGLSQHTMDGWAPALTALRVRGVVARAAAFDSVSPGPSFGAAPVARWAEGRADFVLAVLGATSGAAGDEAIVEKLPAALRAMIASHAA